MGLAGAQQLAQLQRTRTFTGASFVAENLCQPASLAAKLAAPAPAECAGTVLLAVNAYAPAAIAPASTIVRFVLNINISCFYFFGLSGREASPGSRRSTDRTASDASTDEKAHLLLRPTIAIL